MKIDRRAFCALLASTTAIAAAPAAWAKNLKLGGGEIYKHVAGSEGESELILVYPKVKFNVGQHLAAARKMGVKISSGDRVQLTDDPRSFDLDEGALNALKTGPVVQQGFTYVCVSTSDVSVYSCKG